ncbi:MAG: ABC transporter permease, partial [Chthoniobacterales bacterium]|nr:ABC transporter permease [Chthoniobacterales bacterium]
AFTFGLSILSTLVFGLVPALQVSRPNLNQALQEGSKGSTGGWHGTRSRSLLVVAQVSLSLVLLSGAGLLIQSFFNLRATDPGFDAARLLALQQVLPRATYSEPEAQRRFFETLLPKLAALPGVENVAGASPLPFSGSDRYSSFRIASEPERGPGTHPSASHLVVVPGYFRTMKIPLRVGRDFDQRDNENATDVVVVNETFVRRFLPEKNPIGERILFDEEEGAKPLEIIGVVGDAKQSNLGAETEPEFYQPFAQAPGSSVWLTLRTATENLSGLQAAIRRIVLEQDADLFVKSVQPMESLLGRGLARPKFNMLLLGIFAIVALVLAAIGIYGVIAYSVAQRTREIGIRMALGGQRGDMLAMILRQSLTVVAIGLAVGLAGALAATRLLASLLYGVGANDVLTYAAVVLLLGAAALLASYIPARRAMKVDPMVALRYE